MRTLISALISLGRKAEAAPYCDRYVRLVELKHGVDTAQVAGSLQDAARVWLEIGEAQRGIANLERALAIRRKVRGARTLACRMGGFLITWVSRAFGSPPELPPP